MNKTVLVLLSSVFFLSPWYLFPSGNLQPVDVAIFCLMFAFFLMRMPYLKFVTDKSHIFRTFLILSGYMLFVLLINFILSANLISFNLAQQSLYYIFLVSIFVMVICYLYGVYPPEKSYRYILILLLIDSILPFIKLLGTASFSFRISLTFNNPNQLGFFALVNLSIFFYATLLAMKEEIRLAKIMSLIIINLNAIFLFLSASRACYPALILCAISYVLIFKPKLRGYNVWLFWAFGVVVIAYLSLKLGMSLFKHMTMTRQTMMPTSYFGLSSDIYFRAFKGISANLANVSDFLFGSGSYSTSVRGNLEFHNNFAAMFNQVGLLGFLLYTYLNIIILHELYQAGILYLIPYSCYLYYSLFHYSYRTRFNWIFLAFVIFVIIYTHLYKERKLAHFNHHHDL